MVAIGPVDMGLPVSVYTPPPTLYTHTPISVYPYGYPYTPTPVAVCSHVDNMGSGVLLAYACAVRRSAARQ